MPANCFHNRAEFLKSWQTNTQYFATLQAIARLSRLFSESETPYLDYRVAENLFCKYFNAQNDARACTAYDARLNNLEIGIKTFTIKNNVSTEKVAEFNKLRTQWLPLKNIDLARQISEFRNDRIVFSNNTYCVNESLYHVVGRQDGLLRLFNVPYEPINIEQIKIEKESDATLVFYDDRNHYTFNKSKSVLQKKFQVPKTFIDISVDIIEDPLDLLISLFEQTQPNRHPRKQKHKGVDYVILPLYNQRTNEVPERSGLNQWNAAGRPRNENEVYIPIPAKIHQLFPNFFPTRDEPFLLELPDGNILSAKVCQDGGKALMSNPNSELGEWILRKILRKKVGELVTMNDLLRFGTDSILVEKLAKNADGQKCYRLNFTSSEFESYTEFIG